MTRLTDDEFVHMACCGIADAIALVRDLHTVCHLWDDIHDGDKPSGDQGMWAAMFDIPRNPFYQRHFATIQPAMQMAALSWRVSEDMESGIVEERTIAHVTRHSLVEVFILISALCGGREHAIKTGPQWWARNVRESLATFSNEMEVRA